MLENAKQGIDKSVNHLDSEYAKLQLGRANPALVEDVLIESYGSLQPLKNSATVGLLDSQTLSIKPWDKTMLHAIAKAITESGLGLNPQSMADSIMIKIPALTEERRKEISKIAKKMSEDAKVSVRNVRAETMKAIKKSEDDNEISEDEQKDLEADLQKMIDTANKMIDEHFKNKEADIMKV
ncbi:MAG: ribosome recycling factor [Candidatus Gracilibacteria bacterium]|nr:ribosome recycling factor [Candidatus Gracilibacteria bacterium]